VPGREPDFSTPPPGWLDEPLRAVLHDLQEQFFPESAAAWGEARPACPGHSHPARAAGDAHAAWWCCPVDARRIAAIGTYASGRSPRH
jgi:hypothetical protein